jgi:hypothetical protein
MVNFSCELEGESEGEDNGHKWFVQWDGLFRDIVYELKWVLYKKAIGKMYETKIDVGTKWSWDEMILGQNDGGRNERDKMSVGRNEWDEMNGTKCNGTKW